MEVSDIADVSQSSQMTIIGVGSSAGGLEAISELVGSLPSDMGAAYVVVQHLSPHHKSLMTELVARQTKLEVEDIVDGLRPAPNVVYITPPNNDVVLHHGALRLVEPNPELAAPKPSIDRFLLSLAKELGDKAVAIILSGTGPDGAYGVRAIHEACGITIAQDSDSAKYDGMPSAAIGTGCVDLVLRPSDIGAHLGKILATPRNLKELQSVDVELTPLSDLLHVLMARTKIDFREYKQTTVTRRIERRMIALGIDDQQEYADFCRTNPQALDALFKDLLISVTRFFRDREEFEQLAKHLPALIEEKGDEPLRVWVAGCATGEEVYSIAILLAEALGGPHVQLKEKVQIFATDIDQDALLVARKGIYGQTALNDVPKKLAESYFVRQGGGVRVIENIRSAILFPIHDVCRDPPFLKVDLLCCRNVLIYFGSALQKRVLARFHYAMNKESLMFIGTAESVSGADELFIKSPDGNKIFRKRRLSRISSKALKPQNRATPMEGRFVRHHSGPPPSDSTDRQMFEALAASLGQNSVLVTEDCSIVRIFGDISRFIQLKEGNELKMHLDLVRRPMREEARSLVTIAMKKGRHRSGVRHLLNEGDETAVQLDIYPIIAPGISERAALLVFNDVDISAVAADLAPSPDDPDAEDNQAHQRIKTLENEVFMTREALQQTIEELETSNAELQSLNEEMQSTNEELQATNEELETSNEELQSTNEELITVNEELQVTAAELSGRTWELTSVLETAPLAILVIDNALQVSQATREAVSRFKLEMPLASPHISQCFLPDGFPALAPLCSETLKLGDQQSVECVSGGKPVHLSCSPFFDMHGRIQGVTLVVME